MQGVLIAVAAMFAVMVWPFGGVWNLFSLLIGGGASESYLFPIYGGLILLSGIVVGCTVSVLGEIRALRKQLEARENEDKK